MFRRIASIPKPCLSSPPFVDTLSHHFLQRCSVSGTAKGKSKIKGTQTLKKSKVTIKKSGSASPKASKKSIRMAELEQLVDDCFNAPTPVRYLTEKQRAREVEREKLGLISKDRQREIDMLKAKAKKGEEDEKEIMGTPGFDYITLGLVDVEKIPKYDLTVEDGRRLAKEYSRILMKRHRARQAAESTLLRLKKEAIEALPENLKVAALVPDYSPFPVNRFMATLTPPIEGYIDKVKVAAQMNSRKEKLR